MLFKTIRKNVTKDQYDYILKTLTENENLSYAITDMRLSNSYKGKYRLGYQEYWLLIINSEIILNNDILFIDIENIRYEIKIDIENSTVSTIYGFLCGVPYTRSIEIDVKDIKYIYNLRNGRTIYRSKECETLLISKIPFYALYINGDKSETNRKFSPDVAYPGDIVMMELNLRVNFTAVNIVLKLPDIYNVRYGYIYDTGYNISLYSGTSFYSQYNNITYDITKIKVITHGTFWMRVMDKCVDQLYHIRNV